MSGPGGIGNGPDRQAANGFAPRFSRRRRRGVSASGVVRLQVVVADRPVDDVGSCRSARGPTRQLEVDRAKTRQLAVGVKARTADRRRHALFTSPVRMRSPSASLRMTVRARLEERIGPEEVPAEELDLVVRHVPERTVGLVEREQVVAALLQHDHRPAGRGEHVGRGRAGGAGADDHRVVVVGGISHGRVPLRRCSRASWTVAGEARSRPSRHRQCCRRTRVRRRCSLRTAWP